MSMIHMYAFRHVIYYEVCKLVNYAYTVGRHVSSLHVFYSLSLCVPQLPVVQRITP